MPSGSPDRWTSVFLKKRPNSFGMAAALISNSNDREIKAEEIEELQKIIDDKKNKIKEKEN